MRRHVIIGRFGPDDKTRVPKAREYAWDEYTRNTLAAHATAFPDHWAGTISVDDTCYSYYATHPANCGNDLYRQYDGQITEQPTWMVMDARRLFSARR